MKRSGWLSAKNSRVSEVPNGVGCLSQDPRRLVEPRLAYHLRCLREEATDPALTNLERLAVVRDRAALIREVRQEPRAHDVRTV